MALQNLFENASALSLSSPDAKLTSSVYEFTDSQPRQLFIGGEIGEAVVGIELSPDGKTWFELRTVDTKMVLPVQAQAGVLLRLTLARDPNAKVNAWI